MGGVAAADGARQVGESARPRDGAPAVPERSGHMFELRLFVASLSLTACVSSEPIGGTPSATETHSGGQSSGDVETDTDDPTTGDVEETHVVILEDCGIALSCDPMHIVLEGLDPHPARECAEALLAGGQPGVVTVDYTVDGDPGAGSD